METIKIILAIKDKKYLNKIAINIASINNALLLATATCDLDIIPLCKQLKPDIIILELTNYDPNQNELINKIHNISVKTSILITSSLNTAEIDVSSALENGANLYMSSLDELNILEGAFNILTSTSSNQNNVHDESKISKNVTELLIKLKLPTHMTGYHYLKKCIVSTIFRKNKLPYSAAKMYKMVAIEFDKDPKNVEKAIYNAVTHINKSCDKDYILRTILNYDVNPDNFTINTKELVTLIADQLRLRYGIN